MNELECFTDWGLAALRDVVDRLQLSGGLERSARFHPGVMEARRCLISFAREGSTTSWPEPLLQSCQVMRMPPTAYHQMLRFLPAAAWLHFGFEISGTQRIGKCYLELAPSSAGQNTSGRLQFLGFKWSMTGPSLAVVTRYRTQSVSAWDDVERHLLQAVEDPLRAALRRVLEAARRAAADGHVPGVLEIQEEGSDRRSSDINLYDAGLRLGNLQTELQDAADLLQIPRDAVRSWLSEREQCLVGHLAAGTGRDGQPFFTVYYGARQLTKF